MADPRFFDNHGPFALAEICTSIGASFDNEASASLVHDVGNLSSAGPQHLSFFGLGGSRSSEDLARSCAGFCIVPTDHPQKYAPSGMTLLTARSVQQAFAAVVTLFYPENTIDCEQQADAFNTSAALEKDVVLGPNAMIGANVEIGANTQIGANAVIGKGVVIGRRCRIGSNVSITHAYIGDDVLILPGACIGQPGFGFVSDQSGHIKIPQIGRVIVQDRVEIGSCTTIDRGALGDTVIGEGSKLDNLVQIGHNTHIGRHCMIVSQVGISGSCEIGDYVVMGGQVGIADHVRAEAGARFAARAGVMPGFYNKGDWAGMPAIPAQEWRRQTVTISRLSRRRKRDSE